MTWHALRPSLLRLTLALAALPAFATEAPNPGFEVETLAPGVYAFVRTKAPGFFLDANSLVVVDDDGVLVVDAQLTPSSAEASIAAIRRLTPQPVRVLINTHRHHDHVGGNEIYRREFPGLQIVGSEAMRSDLVEFGEATMAGWTGWAGEMTGALEKRLAAGTKSDGAPLTVEERASLEGDLAAARALVADAPRMHVVPPDTTIRDRWTLYRPAAGRTRTIEIFAPGEGHTRGDLVVWLPEERILATGDLLTAPVPLVGGDQAFVAEWVETLSRLAALGATTYLPGHGPVLTGPADLELYRDFLTAIVEQTRAAMSRGLSAEEAATTLDLARFRERMAGKSPVLARLFASWGPAPAVEALYRVRGESSSNRP